MSNEYCIGVIGHRWGCNSIENRISYDGITYDLLIPVDSKIFLLDVERSPEFQLKSKDSDTRLELFFKPQRLSKKCLRDDSKNRIVEQFFDIPGSKSIDELHVSSENVVGNLPPSTADVYSMLHNAHKKGCQANQKINLPTFFLPTLRPYQSNGLQWMLTRERVTRDRKFVPVKCFAIPNKMFYFNERTRELLDFEPCTSIPTGGILADEMGLGKTVEILALILSNPNLKRTLSDNNDEPATFSQSVENKEKSKLRCICSDAEIGQNAIECPKCLHWQHVNCIAKYSYKPITNYICPDCWKIEQPVRSSTSFIICPSSIKTQWKSEIRNHISSPNFKVFDYNGIRQDGWISPVDLAKYDVVLCDYSTMKSEIHYANPSASTKYNTRIRKNIIPASPLTKLLWYRVILDEAQMVETPRNKCSKMVKKLPAVHRWAVTGTPIEKSIDDLYGLMVFLDYEPYANPIAWKMLTDAFNKGDARPIIDQCLKNIMWRTSKINVTTELNIPKQQEIIHNVTMNELEARFYFDEHSKCELEFNQTVAKLTSTHGGDALKMNAKTLKLIMEPLRKLRRDCTVPTTVEKIQGLFTRKIIKTYTDLHNRLVMEHQWKCDQQLKFIALRSNTLAESLTEKGDSNDAIDIYKHVLNLVKVCNEGSVCVTSLPPLKSLRSLLEIARLSNGNLSEIETDCLTEIERLEWQHLKKTNDSLKETMENRIERENQVAIHTNDDDGSDANTSWWSDFLDVSQIHEDKILKAINRERQHYDANNSVTSYQDVRDIIHSWLKEITEGRHDMKNLCKELPTTIKPLILLSPETVAHIIDHEADSDNHIGPNIFKNLNHDPFCLQCHISKVTEVLQKCKSLLYSCQEKMLRAIFPFVRNKDMKRNANKHFVLIELLKIEFKVNETYLSRIKDGVAMWMQFKTPKVAHISRLLTPTTGLTTMLKRADEKFNRNLQTLKYVKYLEKNKQPGVDCPICLELPILTECVLECGHKMCLDCFMKMKKIHPVNYRCHSCRNVQLTDNSYLVSIESPSVRQAIIGDYSNKIQEIVRIALNLRKLDPEVKIVIFSHWCDILSLIATALYKNGVQNRGIDEFKNKDLNVTCLLLPLDRGSRGLNLIEATHVFLVEPILDPAEELQAIGRIHRFGQTKTTFVHRFIVSNTIEETIFTTISKDMTEKWKTTDITVDDLKRLFKQHRQID